MTSEAAYVAPERAHAQEAGGVSFGRDLPMGRFLLAIPLPTWLAALFDRLLPNSLPQGAQVRLTQYFQSLFKFLRAIAIAASPWLGSVHITAVLACVRVFNAEQIKIPLPIRPFFLQGCRAKADFNPGADAIFSDAGLLHILQVFLTRHGAPAKIARFNCS